MKKFPHDPKHQALRALLKSLRLEANLRQDDLALKLGRPQSFVSKYELGEYRVDVVDAFEICEALGVPFVEFAQRFSKQVAKI